MASFRNTKLVLGGMIKIRQFHCVVSAYVAFILFLCQI